MGKADELEAAAEKGGRIEELRKTFERLRAATTPVSAAPKDEREWIAEAERLLSDEDPDLVRMAEVRNAIQRLYLPSPTRAEAWDSLLVKARNPERRQPIPTGIFDLDAELRGGITPGVYVIGARKGGGKTTMATQWGESAANAGYPVLFVSFELSEAKLFEVQIARWSQIEHWRGAEDSFETREGLRCMKKWAHLWTHFDGRDIGGAREIMDEARKIKALHGGKHVVVVVDYLQRMTDTSGRSKLDNRLQIEDALKHFGKAEDGGICVVLVSQTGRESYRANADRATRDTIGDFAESSGIEATADFALTIGPREETLKQVYIAKNRWGRAGVETHIKFDGPRLTFHGSATDWTAGKTTWTAGMSSGFEYAKEETGTQKPARNNKGKVTPAERLAARMQDSKGKGR